MSSDSESTGNFALLVSVLYGITEWSFFVVRNYAFYYTVNIFISTSTFGSIIVLVLLICLLNPRITLNILTRRLDLSSDWTLPATQGQAPKN